METKRLTRLSMLLALSIVLNIIENLVPLFNGTIPGVKLGLANIVILFVLYEYGFKDAIFISLVRVFLVSILNTGLFSVAFFLSLSGAILSIIVMGLIKRFTKLSIVGVSILGSLAHSLGQIIMVAFFLNSLSAFNYLPIIIMFAVPTGILTGTITKELVKYFE